MSFEFQLTEAGNTLNLALEALHRKGYSLWVEHDDDNDEAPTVWCAQKDGRRFNAFGPLALVGLVAIWEQFGDNWQESPLTKNWYDDLFAKATGELDQ